MVVYSLAQVNGSLNCFFVQRNKYFCCCDTSYQSSWISNNSTILFAFPQNHILICAGVDLRWNGYSFLCLQSLKNHVSEDGLTCRIRKNFIAIY